MAITRRTIRKAKLLPKKVKAVKKLKPTSLKKKRSVKVHALPKVKTKAKHKAKIIKKKAVVKKPVPDEPMKIRFAQEAVEGIQEAAENYLVELLKHANLCAIHTRRTKIFPKDIHIARILRGEVPIELPLHVIDLDEIERENSKGK